MPVDIAVIHGMDADATRSVRDAMHSCTSVDAVIPVDDVEIQDTGVDAMMSVRDVEIRDTSVSAKRSVMVAIVPGTDVGVERYAKDVTIHSASVGATRYVRGVGKRIIGVDVMNHVEGVEIHGTGVDAMRYARDVVIHGTDASATRYAGGVVIHDIYVDVMRAGAIRSVGCPDANVNLRGVDGSAVHAENHVVVSVTVSPPFSDVISVTRDRTGADVTKCVIDVIAHSANADATILEINLYLKMVKALFGQQPIFDGELMSWGVSQQPLNLVLDKGTSDLTTVIVYDLAAPSPMDPSNSPYVQFLEVNIRGSDMSTGDVLLNYEKPSPPKDSGRHVYVIDLFRQRGRIDANDINVERSRFPIQTFINRYRLTHHDRIQFSVQSESSNRMYDGAANTADDDDRKYCSCVLDVAAKQPVACNIDKAWFRERENVPCVNPYAVCHASVKGESGAPECTRDYYDFDNMPDRQLIGYASLHNKPIPNPYNRKELLEIIKRG